MYPQPVVGEFSGAFCKNTISTAEYAAAAAKASNIRAVVATATKTKNNVMNPVITPSRVLLDLSLNTSSTHRGPSNMPRPTRATIVPESPSTLLSFCHMVLVFVLINLYSSGCLSKRGRMTGVWRIRVLSSTFRNQDLVFGCTVIRSSWCSMNAASSSSIGPRYFNGALSKSSRVSGISGASQRLTFVISSSRTCGRARS
jgi:hypothetical protein